MMTKWSPSRRAPVRRSVRVHASETEDVLARTLGWLYDEGEGEDGEGASGRHPVVVSIVGPDGEDRWDGGAAGCQNP